MALPATTTRPSQWAAECTPFRERKLGALEHLCDMVHPIPNFICVPTVFFTSQNAISPEDLQQAVSLWIQRHQLLRVCVEARPDGKYYVPIEIEMSPELVRCLPEVSDWIRLAESEMTRRFENGKGPLWRVHFGPDEPSRSENGSWQYIFMLTVHHSITDGINLTAIICELLDLLSGRSAPKEAVFELPPCTEQLLFEGKFAYEGPLPELDEKWVVRGRKIPESFGDKLVGKGSSRILPFSFTSQATDCLIRLSKKHDVKMNATLCTVASIAMAQLMEENGERVPETVQFFVPVNLRSSLGIDSEQMGVYISRVTCRTELRSDMEESIERFWQLAKKQNDELHARLDRGVAQEAVKMTSFAMKMLASGIPETMPLSDNFFTVTNVGSFNYPTRDVSGAPISIDAFHRVASSREMTHAINTVNGRLFWNLVFNDKLVRVENATRYKQLVEEGIDAIARED